MDTVARHPSAHYSFDMLDTVLFEFDGVLAETASVRRDTLLAALRAEGFELSADEYREHCAGLASEEGARAALAARGVTGDDTLTALVSARADRAFREYVSKGVNLCRGARDLIEMLQPTVRLGIVSRANREDIWLVLSLARLEQAFTCVIGAEDAFPPKPSHAPYRAALARLNRQRPVPVRRVIVALEDGIIGFRSARAAGVRCIAVGDLPAHVAMEADGCLESLDGVTRKQLTEVAVERVERIQ